MLSSIFLVCFVIEAVKGELPRPYYNVKINNDGTFDVAHFENEEDQARRRMAEGGMTVFVQKSDGDTRAVEVPPDATVASLREAANVQGLNLKPDATPHIGGEPLMDENAHLADIGVTAEVTVVYQDPITIKVHNGEGNTVDVPVTIDTTVKGLKEAVEGQGIEPESGAIPVDLTSGKLLGPDEKKLTELGVGSHSVVVYSNLNTVYVQSGDGAALAIEVKADVTVEQLRAKAEARGLVIAAGRTVPVFDGVELEDDKALLLNFGVKNDAMITFPGSSKGH